MKRMSTPNVPQARNRKIFISQQVTQESMVNVVREILEINEEDQRLKKLAKLDGFKYKPKPIKIFIDTYGGLVYQCFGLISVMNASKTPIHTIVTGCAMSCGFIIAIHGHRRFAYPNATLLYHQVSSGAVGKVADMEARLNQSKRLQKKIEDMVVERTKITKERLRQSYKEREDWHIEAAEAKKLNCIDEIIS